jgi:hypothetical protein
MKNKGNFSLVHDVGPQSPLLLLPAVNEPP